MDVQFLFGWTLSVLKVYGSHKQAMVCVPKLGTPFDATVAGDIPSSANKDVVKFFSCGTISAIPGPSMDILPLVEGAKYSEVECTTEGQQCLSIVISEAFAMWAYDTLKAISAFSY